MKLSQWCILHNVIIFFNSIGEYSLSKFNFAGERKFSLVKFQICLISYMCNGHIVSVRITICNKSKQSRQSLGAHWIKLSESTPAYSHSHMQGHSPHEE